jgi:hypothetical protein
MGEHPMGKSNPATVGPGTMVSTGITGDAQQRTLAHGQNGCIAYHGGVMKTIAEFMGQGGYAKRRATANERMIERTESCP